MTSHASRSHLLAFGARALEKSESVYYNLQFWLFFWHFSNSPGLIIFSPKTFLEKPMWLGTLCGSLAQLSLPQKVSHTPSVHLSWNPNCLEMNLKASTYSFQAKWLLFNDLPLGLFKVRSRPHQTATPTVFSRFGLVCGSKIAVWVMISSKPRFAVWVLILVNQNRTANRNVTYFLKK